MLRRTSDVEPPVPSPAQSPAQSPKATSGSSRTPFSSSVPAAEPAETETADGDDEDGGDISAHVARAGVVSGKMYRKSVLVSTMPKAPDAPPQKEGYLMKKSPAMLVGWQKRYFVTNANGDIEYYKSVCFHDTCILRVIIVFWKGYTYLLLLLTAG